MERFEMERISLWARKGQSLSEHISEMLIFYGKYFLNLGYIQRISKRLNINYNTFNTGLIDTILFHDIGKIVFHESLNEYESPSSFQYHEIMSSLILHLISNNYKLKKNYDLHKFSINDLIVLSVHTAILSHLTTMGLRISIEALDKVYKKYINNSSIREKLSEIIVLLLEDIVEYVKNDFPEFKSYINNIIKTIDSRIIVNNMEFLQYKQYKDVFMKYLLPIYLLAETKPLYVKVSIIATRYLKILMLADNFSACKGDVKNKKYFLDFNPYCTTG
jgi:CRISPR-associated endonuclease Cas3-HD